MVNYILTLLIINLFLLVSCVYIIKPSISRVYLCGILLVTFLIIYNSIFSNLNKLNINSLFFVTLSNVFVLFTSVFLSQIKIKLFPDQKHTFNNKGILNFYFFSISCLVILFLGIGSFEKLIASWIEVKDTLQDQSFYRVFSMIFFFIALSYLRKNINEKKNKLLFYFPGLLLLLSYILIIRVKMFIVPLILIFIIPKFKNIRFKHLLKVSIFSPIIYLIVMFFRWLGDLNDFSIDKSLMVFNNVIEAGIEREMFSQYHSVFNHYYNSTYNTDLGGSYLKFITEPFARIFNFSSIPNPMYKYHLISNNYNIIQGGSAHPGIYGDSFASFGLFGCIVPSIILIFTYFISEDYRNTRNSLLLVSYSLFLALIIRGSTYYALLYFSIIFLIDYILKLFSRIKLPR